LVANEPAALARHASLVARRVDSGQAVVVVSHEMGDGFSRLDVSAVDAHGLLARSAATLAAAGLDVFEAGVSVWGGDAAVQTFVVRTSAPPDPEALGHGLTVALSEPAPAATAPEAKVSWDDDSSPWTTVSTIEAPDRTGLLAALSAAFAVAGADVQSVRATTAADGTIRDVFEVTNSQGGKLDDTDKARVLAALAGETPSRARIRSPWVRTALRGAKAAPVRDV